MKICLVSVEIFAWGKYGGFGRATRIIGRELVQQGLNVCAIVPLRQGQKPIEFLDGIEIHGYDALNPFSAFKLFREIDADIYHSQEPSFGTYLAKLARPDRKHIITFRDTRLARDWLTELKYPSLSHTQVVSNIIFEDNPFVHSAVRRSDDWFAASKLLISKARLKYKLSKDPVFLPTPVPFPDRIIKSTTPLVCFIGRMDRRKRPQVFFELARSYPDVMFEAAGESRDSKWETSLRETYSDLPNLKFHKNIDQFSSSLLSDLLARCWIIVNSSARESLPTTFVEAAVHGCAILGGINPDSFTEKFGYYVRDGNYEKGLAFLLAENKWLDKGNQAMEQTRTIFSPENSIREHINIYQDILAK